MTNYFGTRWQTPMTPYFAEWERTGQITAEMLSGALEVLVAELDAIGTWAERGPSYGWGAYGAMLTSLSFFNMAAVQQPQQQQAIIRRLLAAIQRLQGAAAKVARSINASGYSIGVSGPWPFSISVSLSFPA